MTLAETRDLIKLDCNVSELNDFTNSRLNRYINLAKDSIQGLLYKFGLKTLETAVTVSPTSTTATISGTTVTDLAKTSIANLMEYEGAIRLIETTKTMQAPLPSVLGIATERPYEDFKRIIDNPYLLPVNSEPIYTDVGASIYIYPTVNSVIVRYYKKLPDLTADSDTIDLPSFALVSVLQKAKAFVYEALGNKEKAMIINKEVEQGLESSYKDYKTGDK